VFTEASAFLLPTGAIGLRGGRGDFFQGADALVGPASQYAEPAGSFRPRRPFRFPEMFQHQLVRVDEVRHDWLAAGRLVLSGAVALVLLGRKRRGRNLRAASSI
jgi:hypothetical protein